MVKRPLPESDALVTMFSKTRTASLVEPIVAARLLRAFTLSMTHPMLVGDRCPRPRSSGFLYGGLQGPPVLIRFSAPSSGYPKRWASSSPCKRCKPLAALSLPALNAESSTGVIKGGRRLHPSTGAVMVGFTLVQVASRSPACISAKVAMGFARDLRTRCFIRSRTSRLARSERSAHLAPSRDNQRRPAGADAGRAQGADGIAAPITMLSIIILAPRLGMSTILLVSMRRRGHPGNDCFPDGARLDHGGPDRLDQPRCS